MLGFGLDDTAQVHEERPVRDMADVDALERLEGADHAVGVLRARRGTGQVDAQVVGTGRRDVECRDDPAGVLDRGGQLADGRSARGDLEANRDGIGDARCGDHVSVLVHGRTRARVRFSRFDSLPGVPVHLTDR